MKKINFLLLLSFLVFVVGCKKKETATTGLDPTIDNVAGTWTLQQLEIIFKNGNGETLPGGSITGEQPNTQVYTINKDLTYTLATTLTNGSGDVYNQSGKYTIIESNFDAKKVKHFNFDNSQTISHIIRYVDQDNMEIYSVRDNNGTAEYMVEYYAKIK